MDAKTILTWASGYSAQPTVIATYTTPFSCSSTRDQILPSSPSTWPISTRPQSFSGHMFILGAPTAPSTHDGVVELSQFNQPCSNRPYLDISSSLEPSWLLSLSLPVSSLRDKVSSGPSTRPDLCRDCPHLGIGSSPPHSSYLSSSIDDGIRFKSLKLANPTVIFVLAGHYSSLGSIRYHPFFTDYRLRDYNFEFSTLLRRPQELFRPHKEIRQLTLTKAPTSRDLFSPTLSLESTTFSGLHAMVSFPLYLSLLRAWARMRVWGPVRHGSCL